MKGKNTHILFFVAGTMLTLFMVFGQACSETSSSSDPSSSQTSKGNGDYYTGIRDELSKSVSSYSESIYDQTFEEARVRRGDRIGPESCGLVRDQVCAGGMKRIRYDNCRVGLSGASLVGDLEQKFSDSSCAYESSGDERLTSYNMTFTNRFEQEFTVSTDNHFDFRGINIGGGIKERRTETGFTSEVLGRRTLVRTKRRGTIHDHSQRSLEPTVFTRTTTDEVTVNSGDKEIMDNLNLWTATYKVRDLQLTRACCHPVSGRLGVTYSGRVQGEGVVEFLSCGRASLTIAGRAYDLQLDACE